MWIFEKIFSGSKKAIKLQKETKEIIFEVETSNTKTQKEEISDK